MWLEMLRIAAVALAAAAVWLRVWEPLPGVSMMGVLRLAFGSWPILKEAIENILARRHWSAIGPCPRPRRRLCDPHSRVRDNRHPKMDQ